jgi:hypothetical protein
LFIKKQLRASEQERPDVAQARREWKVKQLALDPEKLVFIDVAGDQLVLDAGNSCPKKMIPEMTVL